VRTRTHKRLDNEGTITRRASDGMYIVKVTVEGVGQKYAGSAKTPSEAQAILSEANRRKNDGAPLKDYAGTVGQWLHEWLTTYKDGKCEVTTYAWYERMIRVHLIPAFGTVKLAALSDGMVQRWINKLEKLKSSATVHHAYKVLHMALSFAALKEKIRRDPTDPRLVKLPELVSEEVELMDEKEQRAFFQRADLTPHSLFFRLTSAMALRRGETLGLKWADFDEDRKVIFIRRSLARVKRNGESVLILKNTKTKSSKKPLPLAGDLALRLINHRKDQKELRLKHGALWTETLKTNPDYEGLIFTTDSGKPVEPRNMERAFKLCLKKAGLPGHFRLHGLRHQAATEMLEAGEDIKVISEFLRHSSVAITERIYVKVRDKRLQAAAEKRAAHMERVAGGKKVA
jgi:integrase